MVRPRHPALALLGPMIWHGCTPSIEVPTQTASPADPWRAEIAARISDEAHAFAPDGDGFVAASPAQGLRGGFDVDGAWLSRDAETIGVRTSSWGRAGAMDAVGLARPTLGACLPGRADAEGDCVQRLEYRDAGLTGWWAASPEGFEQGWTLAAPPMGRGPLRIEVAIEGAAAVVRETEVWLEGDGGERWIVSGLLAWDADGRSLAARFEPASGGLLVVIDDDDARYPVEIDPVYSTASTTLAEPTFSSSNYGYAVSGAGDVNGDGYDDVIVGDYVLGYYTGRAWVYHGSASGVSSTAATTLKGPAYYSDFGGAVSGAGDVNGDGYDDVIVGASGADLAMVYAGSSSGVSSTALSALTGTSGTGFGGAVSGAGDVNGDGYDDVIVGAYDVSSYTGEAAVYHGSAGGLSSTAATTLSGPATGSWFGGSVSGAGDVNGDGYDDVIVGAYKHDSGLGAAYVYHGSSSGLSSAASTSLSESAAAWLGRSAAGAGDVNGDGYDDVIVGAYGTSSYTGTAYLYPGSASGVSSTAATTLTGESINSAFGATVSGAGDVNGDGYDDVIIGAKGYASSYGRAYVFPGSASGLSSVESTLTGSGGYELGRSVSGAGDVNGDGYDDVIVGAYLAAYLHHGYPMVDRDDDGVHDDEDCDDTDASVGATDDDGDGYLACEDDCDDADASVHPLATDVVGDGVDQDCDGLETCFADADADGYRGTAEIESTDSDCSDPYEAVESLANGDCDDADASVHPGAAEVDADGVDQDCDGAEICIADADLDGFAGLDEVVSTDGDCDDPGEALSADAGADCDDSDSSSYPGASELPGDEIDEDCDGLELCYADTDADGYRTDTTVSSADLRCTDVGEALATAGSGDCDDGDATIYPGAREILADGVDQDCDGYENCYSGIDTDGDGYVNGELVISADSDCTDADESMVPLGEDCDDGDAATHPGATEIVGDSVDQDCDAAEICYADADADGYRASDGAEVESLDVDCSGAGEATDAMAPDDCDDTDPTVHPEAEEIVDSQDNDCDGHDETWDGDGDGLTDVDEAALGTDPGEADTDGDGLDDGEEIAAGTDALDADTDGDGLDDGEEVGTWGSDPLRDDSDGDGLYDNQEVSETRTDPALADTDGDGLDDGEEIDLGLDPTRADTDDDGLSDGDEHGGATDPTDADSDDDGLSDGIEILDTATDPNDPDSDDDELLDGEEITSWNTDPNDEDSDGDGLDDARELELGTNPNLADTDGGGVDDLAELNQDQDPLDPSDDQPDSVTKTGCATGAPDAALPSLLLALALTPRRRGGLRPSRASAPRGHSTPSA